MTQQSPSRGFYHSQIAFAWRKQLAIHLSRRARCIYRAALHLNVMQSHLTRFPKIDAVFTINDPQAVGTDLAAKQLGRKNIIITSVDGAPDIEGALKSDTLVQASASQDPYMISQKAVEIGQDVLNGKKPAQQMTLLPSTLVTRANVKDYKGWQAAR